jgi:hypothetical protein
MRLSTPTGRGQFSIAEIRAAGIVLLLGRGEWRTPIEWSVLEGIVPLLLARGGTIEIGSRHDVRGKPGTLDEYLKVSINRTTAGWVAALLERARVVDLVRVRLAYIRLKPDFA